MPVCTGEGRVGSAVNRGFQTGPVSGAGKGLVGFWGSNKVDSGDNWRVIGTSHCENRSGVNTVGGTVPVTVRSLNGSGDWSFNKVVGVNSFLTIGTRVGTVATRVGSSVQPGPVGGAGVCSVGFWSSNKVNSRNNRRVVDIAGGENRGGVNTVAGTIPETVRAGSNTSRNWSFNEVDSVNSFVAISADKGAVAAGVSSSVQTSPEGSTSEGSVGLRSSDMVDCGNQSRRVENIVGGDFSGVGGVDGSRPVAVRSFNNSGNWSFNIVEGVNGFVAITARESAEGSSVSLGGQASPRLGNSDSTVGLWGSNVVDSR